MKHNLKTILDACISKEDAIEKVYQETQAIIKELHKWLKNGEKYTSELEAIKEILGEN